LAAGVARQLNVGYWAETFTPFARQGSALAMAGGGGRAFTRLPAMHTPHFPTMHGGRGRYGHLAATRPGRLGPGVAFSSRQRQEIIEENMRRNGGVLRCDRTGEILNLVSGYPNSVEIDHITPKRYGGSNDYSNAQVVSRTYNRRKGSRWSGRQFRRVKRASTVRPLSRVMCWRPAISSSALSFCTF